MKQKIEPLAFSFSDITLFNFIKMVENWKMHFLQIESGVFLADLKQYIAKDYQLGYAKFNKKVKQEGYSPEGIWTFAFVNEVKIYWRNYKVNPNSVIIYSPGSEINAVSDANFEVMTFSISKDYLEKIAKQEKKEVLFNSLKTIPLLTSDQPMWSTLRDSILLKINKEVQNLNDNDDAEFKENFTIKLLNLLENSTICNDKVSSIKRLDVLKKAEDYIINNITEPVTVSKLALSLKVSERNLLYIFRNRFEIGPKAFMKVLKLNHLHNRLHHQQIKSPIANIARDSGFWHMGQLYKDYKKFFGELPSETLKKSIILMD